MLASIRDLSLSLVGTLSSVQANYYCMRKFPFIPKSSLSLSPGDFWGFKLKDGTWACGRVLQLRKSGPNSRMWFFGALLDWNGAETPNADSIAGAKALRQGTMHIDSIKRTGSHIEGTRSLKLEGIEPWLCISGNDVQRGNEYVRAWNVRTPGITDLCVLARSLLLGFCKPPFPWCVPGSR